MHNAPDTAAGITPARIASLIRKSPRFIYPPAIGCRIAPPKRLHIPQSASGLRLSGKPV